MRPPHPPRSIRASLAARPPLAALALLLALAGPAGAALAADAPAAPRAVAAAPNAAAITEAEVREFMRGIEFAARARDVARLGAALADDCRLELRSRIDGRENVTQFTKAEYVAMLDGGYAAMRDLRHYDYRIVDLAVAVEPGGGAADVRATVVEEAVLGDRAYVTRSAETSRVERRDGRLVLVAVTATTESAVPPAPAP